jgi:hypothetical protein
MTPHALSVVGDPKVDDLLDGLVALGLVSRATAARGIPNAQLKLFQVSGHRPFVEEPDAFRASVGAFLAQAAQLVAQRTTSPGCRSCVRC